MLDMTMRRILEDAKSKFVLPYVGSHRRLEGDAGVVLARVLQAEAYREAYVWFEDELCKALNLTLVEAEEIEEEGGAPRLAADEYISGPPPPE